MPVENQISSQQPGFSAIALKLAFHISFVSVSFARKRIDMSGQSAECRDPRKAVATAIANNTVTIL